MSLKGSAAEEAEERMALSDDRERGHIVEHYPLGMIWRKQEMAAVRMCSVFVQKR